MKIISLRLRNINSFKEDLYLDFTKPPLCTTSLFAITGPTGSGKTTLLDAISVALYNKTPRLDGKGNRSQVNLLSQGTEEGFSEVVFQVNGTRYLAEWRVKRKKNGRIEPGMKLINADTGELITNRRSGRPSHDMADISVEEAVTRLLGMDFGAFRRSILLAQGEFASFLRADAEKKREILEATTGMDLYEQLKEILNQQVRSRAEELGKVEAALEAIPAASAGEIQAAGEELAHLEAELLQLSSQKAELNVEKEKELLRIDSHWKLDMNRKRWQELTSKKNEMQNLEAEHERAVRAAGIRSELDSYLSEKELLEDLLSQLQKSRSEQEEAGIRFEEARRDYEITSRSAEQARIEADGKRRSYDQAAVHETKGRGLLEEAAKKQEEASAVDQKIRMQQETVQQKREGISLLEQSTAIDQAFLDEHPMPDNMDNLLAQASEVRAMLAGKEEMLTQRNDGLQKAKKACQSLNDTLSRIARERGVFETKKARQSSLLENTRKALHPHIEEGDQEYWRALRSAWIEVQSTGDEFLGSCDKLISIFEGRTPSQLEYNKTLCSYRQCMEQFTLEIASVRERLKRSEAEEKLAVADHQALVLRQDHLRDGQPCPVCGSTVHPGAREPEPDTVHIIETARKNVETARSELERNQDKLSASGRKLAGLARDRASACDETIMHIESLTTEKRSIENELQLLDEKIRGICSQEASLNQQKEALMQEMDEHMYQIDMLKREITEQRTSLFSLIPESGPPDIAIETFKGLIGSMRQAKARLEASSIKLAKLTAEVQEISRHLTEDVTRHEQLLSEYAHYRREGDNLMARVMELTEGQGVDGARSALDIHIQELETQKEEKRGVYDQASTVRTSVTSKVEGLKKDHERLSIRCTAARSRYFLALETSGFVSMEEHSSSFRHQDWLDDTEKILKQFQQDVHTVEETISSLQAVFALHPYRPEDVQSILTREQALTASIDEKNNLKGDMNRKMQTLKENLKKRQEQERLVKETRKEMERWQRLAQVMPANSLRDFALQTMFDLLITFANQQLSDITSRYALKAVDMKDMVVIDRWNAGEERPVETLSGGESFLVSLSLALALSELSSGRCRLESLFLDEGFGTLDPETLDAALYALESLRLSGRTIGVISHIDQLTKRIPVRIEVTKKGNGSSGISIKG